MALQNSFSYYAYYKEYTEALSNSQMFKEVGLFCCLTDLHFQLKIIFVHWFVLCKVIGIGAGQQSRIHCTRLAGDKANNWYDILMSCFQIS